LLAAVWGLAVSARWTGPAIASVFAFGAIALLPGALVVGLRSGRSASPFEIPARALTISTGIATVAGAVALAAGFSIVFVAASLFAVSLAFALAPAGPARAGESELDEEDGVLRSLLALLALVAAAATLTAAADANIARDRMWYLAYVTDLSADGPLDWAEPFFGSGKVLPRFAHNGWLLVLASWQRVTGIEARFLFERIAPVLLVPVTASAALVLGRACFANRRAAALAALASMVVLTYTRYPYFSPEHYPFMTRLVEDKSVALLVFLPVAIAAARDLARNGSGALTFGVALVACAFTHALVYALLLIALCTLAAFEFLRRSVAYENGRPVLAAALVISIAAGPAWLGLSARSTIVGSPDPHALLESDPEHPVVRSHLRMDRLVDTPAGGPVVDPALLFDPVLLICLCGALALLGRRPGRDGALLGAMTFPFLALAFLPWVSPAFGRAVVPWMAYRALWTIPFGCLFAALVFSRRQSEEPRVVTAVAAGLAAIVVISLPWERIFDPKGRAPDAGTERVIETISRLSPTTRVAAAPGFAELIPALAGRRILAFSDRGTTVFAESKRDAERRMQANTAIVGLAPGSPRLRRRLVEYYGVTHTVRHTRGCPTGSVQIARGAGASLCAERAGTAARPAMRRSTAVAPASAEGFVFARIDDGVVCTPAPTRATRPDVPGRFRWKRSARWSARPVAINCRARFSESVRIARLRLELNLPRAEEALVYRISVKSSEGKRLRRQGVIEFLDNPNGEIALPPVEATRVRMRILPAYLPYLNLRGLALLG
jgi:hypothetical protein